MSAPVLVPGEAETGGEELRPWQQGWEGVSKPEHGSLYALALGEWAEQEGLGG